MLPSASPSPMVRLEAAIVESLFLSNSVGFLKQSIQYRCDSCI